MASNFIPMLSSSPPPLDDCPDDDDEEFGTFTSANIAFDTSFDSPVAGEKYKNYIKTGENGINDLNSFDIPTQNYNMKFSQQNQNNHIKSKRDKEDTIAFNSDGKVTDECRSSTKELNAKNKECSIETSHDFVPGDLSDNSDAFEENDRSKRKLFPEKSNEKLDLNSTHSNVDSFDIDDSIPVPPSDEIEVPDPSKDVNIPCVDDSHQSTDLNISNCDDSIDFDEICVDEHNSVKDSNYVQKTINSDECKIETSVIQFETSFLNKEDDSFEDFDDFQGVQTLSAVPGATGGLVLKDSVNEDEPFEANFDDFQSFESKQVCESTQFQSASVEKEQSNDDDEFADFKAASNEACHSDDDGFDDFKAANNKACHSDDDGFDDFKAEGDDNIPSEINEFDDFQSFDKPSDKNLSNLEESNEAIKPLEIEQSFGQPTDQDDFDDFDDFQACSEIAAPTHQGFAAFKEEPEKDKDGSESPEFANFERASFSSASGETYPNSPCLSSSSHNQEKIADKLSTVMNAIFPLQAEPNEEVSNDLESEIVDQSVKGRRLWEKLHEAEQTPGLRFQWGVSHSFQQLLRSVNVDYHSILRTSSVPIFASGLSLLEPVKGQTSSVSTDLDDKASPSPRDPPVEFDWNSSGLVNPLDTGQLASDLSFLSTLTSSATVGEDHSFENELLKPSPTDAFPECNKTFILEELLSKNLSSIPNSNIPHRPTNLSEEANSVLDQLPDLSYMRAKVLMFPIT